MAGDFRVLGRDHTMRLIQNGQVLAETSALKNIDMKLVQTLLSEGFLGEVAKRHREVFDEVDLSWGVEPEGKQIFQMQNAIYTRARQSSSSLVINVSFRIQFPSGTIVRITVPDLKFGTNGDMSVPGREQFSTMSFAAKSDRYIPNFK